jgi:hypothetical protein
MARFIEAADRRQVALLPESLDDYVDADNPVRVVDAYVDALDLTELGFDGVTPEATGRPAIIRRLCSRSTCMATSTRSSPHAGSNASAGAISS